MPPDPTKIQAAKDALDVQDKALADAKSDRTAQQTQWDTMRKDVFHTDKSTSDAVKRLEAKGVPPDKVTEFKNKAGRLQTPDQVSVLEAGY